jgi:hypothetical protein
MKKMKKLNHVKLFEDFSNGENLLIGYYGEGGYGSHPAILSPVDLQMSKFSQKNPAHLISTDIMSGKIWTHTSNEFKNFTVTDQVSSVPGALVCAYNDDYQWDIKGISKTLGQEIMKMIGGDTITSFGEEDDLLKSIEEMLGLPQTGNLGTTLITIIIDPKPGTVYWSDEPERAHSYWMPPYRPMTLDELA